MIHKKDFLHYDKVLENSSESGRKLFLEIFAASAALTIAASISSSSLLVLPSIFLFLKCIYRADSGRVSSRQLRLPRRDRATPPATSCSRSSSQSSLRRRLRQCKWPPLEIEIIYSTNQPKQVLPQWLPCPLPGALLPRRRGRMRSTQQKDDG